MVVGGKNNQAHLWTQVVISENLTWAKCSGNQLGTKGLQKCRQNAFALWLLRIAQTSERMPTKGCRVPIRGKESLGSLYLSFSSTAPAVWIYWPQEDFHGKVLHCNGSTKAGSRLSSLICIFPSLASRLQKIIPGISTFVNLHSKWNFKV